MKIYGQSRSRMPMRRALPAVLGGLMVVVAGCGSDSGEDAPGAAQTPADATDDATTPADEEPTLPDELVGDGVLQVATSGAFPPMNFTEEGDDEVVGVAVDLITAMADELGLEVEMVVTDFASILTGIDSERFDSGVIFVDNEERRELVDILDVLETGVQFLVPAGYEGSEIPPCGSTIAVAAGSHELEVLEEVSAEECESQGEPAYEPDEYPSNDNAALALTSDRAVAFLTSAENGGHRAQQEPDEFKVVGPVYDPSLTGFAFSKEYPELTRAMADAFDAVLSSGEYSEILEKWSLPQIAIDEPYINTEPVE